MMVESYRQLDTPRSQYLLFHWHEMLMNGRRDIKDTERYRTDEHAMQVVLGPLHQPKLKTYVTFGLGPPTAEKIPTLLASS